jgi:DNA helicase-2/ATP-dependent DNA helicase PcrA
MANKTSRNLPKAEAHKTADLVFQTLYAKLNPAQRSAVEAIDGPVMVIAGPGTGKTTILTLRIANILRQTDTPANGILAITYTDAGVKAMRAKLENIIGTRAHDVRITTFHGFASAVIAEYPDHFLHLSELKQMTDIEQETLIRHILTGTAGHGSGLPLSSSSHASISQLSDFSDLRPAGKPDYYVSGILRAIDDAKREEFTPDMVRAYARDEIKRIENDDSSISTRGATKGQLKADAREVIEKCKRTLLFADVYACYESGKRQAKKMDFNDLILELLAALRHDELLLRLIQERYLYILVDEHQDTNDAQNSIIHLIAEFFDTPNVFIVGDEKQAIYRFQGASVENFLLLQKHWPNMQVIRLDTNYRSHQSILDASFSMIEKNYEEGEMGKADEHTDLRIRLKSASGDKARPIDIVTGENVTAMEAYLVKELKQLSENYGSTLSGTSGQGSEKIAPTIAVIVRRNRDLDRVIRLLESNNIAVSSERSVDIFGHPVGRLFFDLIEYLTDPSKTDALAKTIIAGMWGLSFDDATLLVRALSSRTGVASPDKPHIETALPALSRIKAELLADGAVGFLIHTAQYSGFTDLIAKDPSYVHVWRGIVALAESLTREGDLRNPTELMQSMLAYRTSAETRKVKVAVGAPDVPLRAMTAHGSKGLEFDYVFVPYATDEAWIGRTRGASFVLPKKRTSDSDVSDIRRLFYVALTRARKHVTVLTALEESDGKQLTPLRFISELDNKHVAEKSLPRMGVETMYATETENAEKVTGTGITGTGKNKTIAANAFAFSPIQTKLVAIAKHVLLEKGLSVTALNHFMDCPSKFIYQSILKMPQAPAVPSEKGNAMHEALAKVWRSEKRGTNGTSSILAKDIQAILKESLEDYFKKSFLPTNEKKSAEKELVEDVPAVAKALEPHFKTPPNTAVFTESWAETEFLGAYAENKKGQPVPVRIPIHGKLDAVLDTGNELFIFDYKTRKAMSQNAIKGETKNDDGNYFRQLIFYKILAESEPRWRGRRITPSLVFVSPDDKGRCPTVTLPIETTDIARVKSEIQSLIDSVWSGTIALDYCTDPECEWCGMKRVGN